jgi:hypothetical protein
LNPEKTKPSVTSDVTITSSIFVVDTFTK